MWGASVLFAMAHADVALKVEGLDGPLQDNVSAYLSSIKAEDYSVSLRFQSQLRDSISDALKALGYYSPEIDFTVEGEQSDEQTLLVQVQPGDPVIIYVSDIILTGEATNDDDFVELVARSKLNLGRELNHGVYESLKSSIRNLALQKGYFDGQFTDTRMQVAPSRKQAFIYLHYDSGERYSFGETSVTGSQIEDVRVRSLIPYQTGEPYLSVKVGELNQNLSSTEWFSPISVQPDIEAVGDSKQLPMKVTLEPQTKNLLETSIGYSTDVGPRAKLSWKKPWLNQYGHSLGSSVMVSQPEKTFTANYKIPLEDVLHEYYLVQYGYKDTDNRDTDSQEQNLSFERHWLYDNGWHRTYYVRFLYEDYRQGENEGQSFFTLPGVSFSRVRTRGGTMPMWGDKLSINVEAGDPALLSDTRIVRLIGHTGWIRGIGQNHRFLTRLDAGGAFADDWQQVPPSLRFFVGGINTLRGYGYEAVSPLDSNGDLEGGAYMLTSSLEYQYRIQGNWWLASFVDYGDAWTDAPLWKIGVGLGVRWASPVGPVRLDFAYGLDADPGDQFRIHFTLGPEL